MSGENIKNNTNEAPEQELSEILRVTARKAQPNCAKQAATPLR